MSYIHIHATQSRKYMNIEHDRRPSTFVNFFVSTLKLIESTRDIDVDVDRSNVGDDGNGNGNGDGDDVDVDALLDHLTGSIYIIVSNITDEQWKTTTIELIREHYRTLGYTLPTEGLSNGIRVNLTLYNYINMLLQLKMSDFPETWKI